MRTMFDADNPYDIPTHAQMVAGYIDGSSTTWSTAMWDRFPGSQKVTISAVGQRWDADVFDVEPGCIWPPENVLPLVEKARANGRWPTVYCNQLNHWPAIRQMFRSRGIEEPPYWVANYDGIDIIPPGAVAKQFMHPRDADRPANRPQQRWETFRHFDLSIVVPEGQWRGVDKQESGEEEMGFNVTFPPAESSIGTISLDPSRNWKLIFSASGRNNQAAHVGHIYNWQVSNDNSPNGTGGDPAGTSAAPQDGGRVDVNEPYQYDVPAGTARCVVEYGGEVVVGAFTR